MARVFLFSAVVCFFFCVGGVLTTGSDGESVRSTEAYFSFLEDDVVLDSKSSPSGSSLVPLTLIQGADAKGAVCLDGSLPGYHLQRGSGSGANNWLVHLEGGGWCNNHNSCVFRKTTRRGSSKLMEKFLNFTGILSDKANENPDFYNWNRIKLRYCDGASFTGDSQDQKSQLFYRGQRIWEVAMETLLAEGMRNAEQALLSGCSAGGLASILHCDEFKNLFPQKTKVKCLSDAGMFLDEVDVSGRRTLKTFFQGVVKTQDLGKYLPSTCTSKSDPTTCFFPQNSVSDIKTPMFLLNSAYDYWQIRQSLVTSAADPTGAWKECKFDLSRCNSTQLHFFQEFRNQMVSVINTFSTSNQNGLFINSCYAHCQSERQELWFAPDSPRLHNKRVAESVGDWYFDRKEVKSIDCPYPCDKTCK